MQRDTFLQLLSPDLAVREKPLFFANSFLKLSMYCSKILIFRLGYAAIPAPS
jgi:hypothetical protein